MASLYIMESIIRPHNEFLRTLLIIHDVDVKDSDVINVETFNSILICCVLQCVTASGIKLTDFAERKLSKYSYSFIHLYSLIYHSYPFLSPLVYHLIPFYKSLFIIYHLSIIIFPKRCNRFKNQRH
jgi:hypothetical protein